MSDEEKRFSMQSRWLVLAASAVLLVVGPAAAAAAPVGPLSGANGCIANPAAAGSDAASVTGGCAKSKGLTGANALAISPDGKNVYVAAGLQSSGSSSPGYGALSTLSRDPASGGLTESGCVSSDTTTGHEGANGACTASAGLLDADAVAVSPDGANVYAASASSGAILGFARDQSSGAITRLGCFQEQVAGRSPCIPAHVYLGSDAVAVAPDGRSAYVGSDRRSALSTLTASLTAPSGGGANASVAPIFSQAQPFIQFDNPCIATAGLDGACSIGASTEGIASLAVSPDGKNLYAAAGTSGAVDVFSRDSAGNLTQTGCLMANAPQGPCTDAKLLTGPSGLAMSPDGKNMYVDSGDRLVILARDPAAGTLSEVGCLDELALPDDSASTSSVRGHQAQDQPDPCTSVPGLDSLGAVAVSPDGSTVYSVGDSALAVFSRDAATGRLTEASCAVDMDSRCSTFPALAGVSGAAVSPDGRNVYVTASQTNGVFALGPGATAAATQAIVGRGGRALVAVACPATMRTACAGTVGLARVTGASRRAPRRGHHGGRSARHLSAISALTRFRLAAGHSGRFAVVVSHSTRRALPRGRGRGLRVLALATPDPGAGGAFGRTVLLRR
jgi:DNA-binding beta-propeller fold protein YncE